MKKSKNFIKNPSHDEIKLAIENYIKSGGEIHKLEVEGASANLEMTLETERKARLITESGYLKILDFP